jgi:AraC family transcriptional regulator, positive regulator of tynA and feaB
MGPLRIVSTDDVSPSERPILIRDTLWNVFGRRGSNFISTTTEVVASFAYASIGDIHVCKLSGSGYGCELAGTKSGDERLEITIEMEGTAYFAHAGRNLVQPPGQWTICDTTKPSRIMAPQGSETLILSVPRDKLVGGSCNLDHLILRPFSKNFGIGKVVCDFVVSVFSELPKLDSQSAPDIADTVSRLLRLSIIDILGARAVHTHKEFLRDRIKSYILGDLRNSELSIDRIAVALHCTKRYLHKVFESEGVSLSDFIWQSRLDRCRDELLDTSRRPKSVTEIAYSWGFSSSAHFSTAFKERFGICPSSYRAEEQH